MNTYTKCTLGHSACVPSFPNYLYIYNRLVRDCTALLLCVLVFHVVFPVRFSYFFLVLNLSLIQSHSQLNFWISIRICGIASAAHTLVFRIFSVDKRKKRKNIRNIYFQSFLNFFTKSIFTFFIAGFFCFFRYFSRSFFFVLLICWNCSQQIAYVDALY